MTTAVLDPVALEQPLLEARDLHLSFKVGRETLVAVDGVDLSLSRGETVALVGESGSGKSSIAKALIRVYEPDGGAINFDGSDVTHATERELKSMRRRVQMVQQDPYSSLDPHLSIERVVGEPLSAIGWRNKAAIRRRVVQLLDEVGIGEDALEKRPAEFSGGQRQRIAVARAIAPEPELLIADEPLSALDVSVQAQLVNVLLDMQDLHRLAYLLISHDLALVNLVADRVVVVYLGRVVEEGPASQLLSAPRHPYTVALLSAVPGERAGDGTGRRIVLAGEPPSAINRPSGCQFHPRCPIARPRCALQSPPLARQLDGGAVACHYPGELALPSLRRPAAITGAVPASAVSAPGDASDAPAIAADQAAAEAEAPSEAALAGEAAAAAEADAPAPAADAARRGVSAGSIALSIGKLVARRALQLVFTVFSVTTALFFLLRLTGDPASVIAGEASSPHELALIKAQYGLDLPLADQYWHFLTMMFTLNFGNSYSYLQPAFGLVWQRLPPTIGLTMLAMAINLVVSVAAGSVIGAFPRSRPAKLLVLCVFVAQGIPFYVVGLLMIQLLTVSNHLLPSLGDSSLSAWVMPSITLAWFLVPRLTRVIAVNVQDSMGKEYVRVARASGAGRVGTIARHALPNALVAAAALAGTQFAYLISGTLIVEEIFGWPGLGRLLIDSITRVDFPVVEAAVVVIATFVYAVNALTDVLITLIDPRTRKR